MQFSQFTEAELYNLQKNTLQTHQQTSLLFIVNRQEGTHNGVHEHY
jgi:hypothetical protein